MSIQLDRSSTFIGIYCSHIVFDNMTRHLGPCKQVCGHWSGMLSVHFRQILYAVKILIKVLCVCRITIACWVRLRMRWISCIVHTSIQLFCLSNTSLLNKFGNSSFLVAQICLQVYSFIMDNEWTDSFKHLLKCFLFTAYWHSAQSALEISVLMILWTI